MPQNNFTSREVEELLRLLKKIQQNNYWIPDQAIWKEMQRTVSRWAIELVITDLSVPGVPKILLTRYNGDGIPEHHGLFHIAGGFDKFPEEIEETCTRIAREELSIDVKYQGILGIHKWTLGEHPWGSRLLSLYVACNPLGALVQKDGRRFFTRQEILALDSTDMAPNHPHRKFALQYIERLESGTNTETLNLGL